MSVCAAGCLSGARAGRHSATCCCEGLKSQAVTRSGSSCVSPVMVRGDSTGACAQAVMGTVVKRHLAARLGLDPASIYHVAVMPCYDKKLEASRDDFNLPGAPRRALLWSHAFVPLPVCSSGPRLLVTPVSTGARTSQAKQSFACCPCCSAGMAMPKVCALLTTDDGWPLLGKLEAAGSFLPACSQQSSTLLAGKGNPSKHGVACRHGAAGGGRGADDGRGAAPAGRARRGAARAARGAAGRPGQRRARAWPRARLPRRRWCGPARP